MRKMTGRRKEKGKTGLKEKRELKEHEIKVEEKRGN